MVCGILVIRARCAIDRIVCGGKPQRATAALPEGVLAATKRVVDPTAAQVAAIVRGEDENSVGPSADRFFFFFGACRRRYAEGAATDREAQRRKGLDEARL